MRTLILTLLLLANMTIAALADTGYFIVKGYGYPQEIVGGPYRDYSTCTRIANAYGYQYHCEIRAY